MLNELVLQLIILVVLSAGLLIVSQCDSDNIIKSLPGYQGPLPFSLETGYVGVREGEDVQLFYYFIQSQGNVQTDPLILWLTGGPGCSAFSGLVFEIGPIAFDDARINLHSQIPKLRLNPHSWTQVASILFLDSPVGTGFSYATNYQASHSSDILQASHIHQFLTKWFLDHPNFRSNSLYVAGDSYAGRIVPRVVQNILNGNENDLVPKMNLKGYALGNPTTMGFEVANSRIEYEHRVSLISDELYQMAEINCNGDFVNIDRRNIKCLRAVAAISDDISSVNYPHILEPVCPELKVSRNPPKKAPGNKNGDHIDYLHLRDDHLPCRGDAYVLSRIWANNVQVREALNIREGTIDRWERCTGRLSYTADFDESVVGYHKNLSHTYLHVLVYSGDHDLGETYVGTLKWIEELQLSTVEEWRPWFVGGQVGGYVTVYGNVYTGYRLSFTTVKGAGHTAPEYKRVESLAMIERWLKSTPL